MSSSNSLSAAEMRAKRVAVLESKAAPSNSTMADGRNVTSDKDAIPEPLTPRSQVEFNFKNCACRFAEEMIQARCNYIFSIRPPAKPPGFMDMGLEDPDKRTYLTIWSRPTPECPTPPAVVHVKIEVKRVFAGGGSDYLYSTDRYQVEYAKHFKDASVPFEGRWLDEVIRRKIQLRSLIELGDDFLNTRLEEKEDGDPEIPLYIPPQCKCAPTVEHCTKCKTVLLIGDNKA